MNIKPSSGACRRFTATRLALTLLLLAAAPAGFGQSVDSFNPSPNDEVDAIAIQTDGKILLGGWFTALGTRPRSYLGRVEADGTVDTNFLAGTDGPVYSLAVQEDGKIIVGGWFSEMNGDWRDFLGRLNPDGSLDTAFNPGANSTVYCLAPQADGKILVGGNFTTLGGQAHNRLARLNPDGALDATFNPTVSDTVYCVAVQPDGKILLGGLFTALNGLSRNYLGRLKSDGSTDATFNPNASGAVYSLAVQPNGKVVVGGWFAQLGGQARTNLARIHPDGTLDLAFLGAANGYVNTVSLQANGKTLIGGGFTSVPQSLSVWTPRYSIGRLASNGLADNQYYNASSYYGPVFVSAIQDDGRILAGGFFSSPRVNTARWTNSEAATQSLACDGASITWLRGGYSPEVWRTTFDLSTNGTDWIAAGVGIRTNGGWKLTGLTAPTNATVRARGWVSGGGSSSWLVETLTGPPTIRLQPANRTNSAGTTATFTVQAAGLGPLGYQWFKGTQPLSNSGSVSGATAATLSLSSVLAADAGGFSVVVTNAYGSVTSSVATLTVLVDLTITSQPSDRTNAIGTVATFAVATTGPNPVSYQWWKDGVNLNDGGKVFGTTNATLTVSNVFGADSGGYSVVVSNPYGSVVTSRTALLTVLDPQITSQPVSRTNNAGTPASFTVQTKATLPCSCQWLKNELPIGEPTYYSGGMPPSLTLTLPNVFGADAGGYAFVISNAYGCVTSTVAVLTVTDPLITTQPVGQNVGPGAWPSFSVTVTGTPSFGYQWRKDGVSIEGATLANLQLTNVQSQAAGYYDVIVSNAFGCKTSTPAVLTVSMATGVTCWQPDFPWEYYYSVQGQPNALALRADGGLISGGRWYFARWGNDTVTVIFLRIGPQQVVTKFTNFTNSETINAVAVQADGRVLVGSSSYYLQRYMADGSCDSSYAPSFTFTNAESVNCLLLRSDGKALVGGSFNSVGGQSHYNLCLLATDGTVDRSFFTGANGSVNSLAAQSDGKIIVGGSFTTLRDEAHGRIGRLYPDGALDTTFVPNANGPVTALAVQADGKILVGGSFTTLNGQSRTNIGRLNSDGTVDPAFNPGANGSVNSFAILANNMVIVGGNFTTFSAQMRNGIARLKADGSLDNTLNIAPEDGPIPVYALAAQADGSFWVGRKVPSLCLWSMPELATQSLSFDGTTATWLRGGASPEVWRTSFATSTDGTNWLELGEGTRIVGGWQLAVPPVLATNSIIRARGWVTGGQYNGSCWFVESSLAVNPLLAPQVHVSDAAGFHTNQFGFTITGLAGQVVVVEAATNLVAPELSVTNLSGQGNPVTAEFSHWTPIATNTLGLGPLSFRDPDASALPWRFYRVRLQ